MVWRELYSKAPAGAIERKEFKALLESWQRKVNGIPTIEENFQVRIASSVTRGSLCACLDRPRVRAHDLVHDLTVSKASQCM